MAFRRPQDPEALERWKAVKRALKAQQKAAAKANPKLLALKKACRPPDGVGADGMRRPLPRAGR